MDYRETSIRINRLAQRQDPTPPRSWLRSLASPEERHKAAQLTAGYAEQALARRTDYEDAIAATDTEHSPVAWALRARVNSELFTYYMDPDSPLVEDIFVIMLEVLAIRGAREREGCSGDGCTHWWHQLDGEPPRP